MKKCVHCGLLNDDAIEACQGCGFTEFDAKPSQGGQPEKEKPVRSVSAERHGRMVTLKCRTPAEALLVQQNLESEGVIALLPSEEQMFLQHRKKGYVEVQVPADAYDSTGDLRSVVEFSTGVPARYNPGAVDLPSSEKLLAAFLGVLVVPGLLVLPWLLKGYREQGEERKAKVFKLCFFVGIGAWVVVILAFLACWR